MIDWITCVVRADHDLADIDAGLFLMTGPGGEIERASERQLQVRGSHSASVVVRSHDPASDFGSHPVAGDSLYQSRERSRHYVWIDGNPAKWLQGHNLYGTDDPDMIRYFVLDILRRLRIKPVQSGITGDIQCRINRIDVTRSFRLDSDESVSINSCISVRSFR